MAEEPISIHKYSNGLTLIAEPMAEVSSAGFVFLLPAGVAHDACGRTGSANVLAEHLFRGAGEMDNRALNERLDNLGLHRQSSVSCLYTTLGGGLIADNLLEALRLHADVIRRPQLAADQFETCQQLALQSLDSLKDDPRQQVSLLVRERFLPYPFGRPTVGKREDLEQLTAAEVRCAYGERFSPAGTVLAVAGRVDFEQIKAAVGEYFGDWEGSRPAEPEKGAVLSETYHQQNEGAQVHVGLMYPSVAQEDRGYYAALTAAGILSGGMGSRLFTEVREKRGLCYAVGASHRAVGGYGLVQCYLGSSPEKAQEALDVMVAELVKLAEGVSSEELERAKTGLRASLIMMGESSGARAAGCVRDYYYLGRVRPLEEIEAAIKAVSIDDVIEHVRAHAPQGFAVATIGPKQLKTPVAG